MLPPESPVTSIAFPAPRASVTGTFIEILRVLL